MLLYIPDSFSLTSLHTENLNVVYVALWVITGDQIKQAGFATAVWPAYLPVLPGIYLPVEFIKEPMRYHDQMSGRWRLALLAEWTDRWFSGATIV